MTVPFVIAQMSDTHVLEPGRRLAGRIDTAAYLRAAVDHLHRRPEPPEVLLLTGDLVNTCAPAEYEHLAELLAPVRIPIIAIPGNHDDPAELARVLASGDRPRVDPDELPVRVVGLATTIAGSPSGRVGAAQLDDLDRRLAARPDHPTLVALHHPPFLTMVGHMDDMGLEDRDALAAVIARHPQVVRVVAGHLHRLIVTTFAGVPAITCPSTAHAVALDLQAAAPPAWTTEPPGMLLHCWRPDAGLVTHFSPFGDWTGPHPFT